MTITRTTRAAAAAVVALGITLGALVGFAPAAHASPPCGTAPNSCHFDSDAASASRPGAAVSGRIYWDSYTSAHYTVTLNDTALGNGKYAVVEVRSRVGDFGWRVESHEITANRLVYSDSVYRGGDRIREIQYRVGQQGDTWISMDTDNNVPGGA